MADPKKSVKCETCKQWFPEDKITQHSIGSHGQGRFEATGKVSYQSKLDGKALAVLGILGVLLGLTIRGAQAQPPPEEATYNVTINSDPQGIAMQSPSGVTPFTVTLKVGEMLEIVP